MKLTTPIIDRFNIHIVCHWILKVHSISYIVKICSCLVTVSTSLNGCKARLVTRDFNLVCLHIMKRTIEVITTKIMAVTNRKTSIV